VTLRRLGFQSGFVQTGSSNEKFKRRSNHKRGLKRVSAVPSTLDGVKKVLSPDIEKLELIANWKEELHRRIRRDSFEDYVSGYLSVEDLHTEVARFKLACRGARQ
jgi:hypothetical protein